MHRKTASLYAALCRTLVLAILSTAACRPGTPGDDADRSAAQSAGSGRTQIVLLGSGTPNAEPDRSGPAVAIVVDDTPYLIDLGPGVVRRAAAAHRAGVEGLEVSKLRTAFITHLHSDHTVGYVDFIFTPWVLERDVPAEVYGPRGLAAMTDHLLAAYEEDIRVRIKGLEPANTEGYKVNVHEIEPGLIYEDANVRVTAFLVPHGAWSRSFGYRFETPDRTIVVSGDTRASPAIVENCRGCDVLIHEVYSQAGFERKPPDWQRYHADSHTSTLDLGRIAAEARPGLLILYHQLHWGATPDEMIAEIRQVYDGDVVFGNDLDVY
jgi:ribonuclease BN (tRNA processing enzyme)